MLQYCFYSVEWTQIKRQIHPKKSPMTVVRESIRNSNKSKLLGQKLQVKHCIFNECVSCCSIVFIRSGQQIKTHIHLKKSPMIVVRESIQKIGLRTLYKNPLCLFHSAIENPHEILRNLQNQNFNCQSKLSNVQAHNQIF